MNFLNILKQCESNISQITRDSGISRQGVYCWQIGLPRRAVFEHLKSMPKYKDALTLIDYDKARAEVPLGRRKTN